MTTPRAFLIQQHAKNPNEKHQILCPLKPFAPLMRKPKSVFII